jgi:YidC/Oxa1 family membrane protein insertase
MNPLEPLYQAIGWVLSFYYSLIPNLGVSIIMLTCTIMLLLFPLTAKQAKSMLAMQQLQPEIKKLQAKHKGDRQKLNEEMMKLYQENKVNPLGGCLPLLVQMPIFISLFSVLRNPLANTPDNSSLHDAILKADEQGHGLKFLGMDLTVTPLDAKSVSYFILVALVVFVGVLQSQQTKRNSPPGGNQQMMMVGRVLPIAFGFFSLAFPAGLVLYFLVSNLWRLGQQELIYRKIHLPHREKQAALDAKSTVKEPPPPSGGGGLRGLMAQIRGESPEPAPNGDADADDAAGGVTNGKSTPAKSTPAKPTSRGSGASAKPAPAKSTGSSRTNSRSNQGRKRSSNKKRKR